MAKKFLLFGKDKKVMKKNQDDTPPEDDKKKEEDDMSLNMDSVLVDEDGNELPLSEMVEAYKASMAQNQDEEKPTLNMDDTIEIDGKEVPVSELKQAYDNACAKKNAEPPTDEPLEDVVDESLKKNSAGKDKKSGKEPNEHFLKLKTNASKGAEPEKIQVNTQRNRLDRGKARYGSAVKVEGGN